MVFNRTHVENRLSTRGPSGDAQHRAPNEHPDELAPLAPLAVMVSFVLVVAGCVASSAMEEWIRYHGAELVLIAYCLYMFLSALLGAWGLHLLLNHHPPDRDGMHPRRSRD